MINYIYYDSNEDIIKKAEDKLLEMTTEMDRLVDFLPRLVDNSFEEEKEYYKKVTQVLNTQSEYFKHIHESRFDSAGLISYYDYGLEWLEQVRLLEFTSNFSNNTKDIHECILKIISLDIDITRLIHLNQIGGNKND